MYLPTPDQLGVDGNSTAEVIQYLSAKTKDIEECNMTKFRLSG